MKGSTKLSLAIALALVGGNAFALGLGSIQVKSSLNQPLNAEISVITDSPAEAAGINVGMATAEDFQRVGLDRARVGIPIDFEVITTGRQPVIRLTTKDPVREPFLDFLVEVNWAKGKVLREYTVLLDPPVMAPALKGSTATVAPAKEAAAAPAQKLAAEPAPKTKPAPVKPPKTTVAAEPKPPKPAPVPKPAPAPKAPAPQPAAPATAGAGEYGPVAEGETLSEIARATRDDKSDVNEMMLALLKANPNAFYKDNINALKRGAILRIPSHDDIKANGNAAAAAAAVRDQNQAWSSGNAPVSQPTLVAKTGAPKDTTPALPKSEPKAKPNEHLALVPPAAGKGGQTTADRPGPASGTGSSNSESKADLARTKEALASREQEVSELKSRVKDLEDINGKDARMLTLKQSEIAELQAKLKDLESKSGSAATAKTEPPKTTTTPVSPPATTTPAITAPSTATTTTTPTTTTPKPADTTPAKTDSKLTAQDIWGKISENEKNDGTKPAMTGATAPASTTSTTPSTGATTPPSSTPTSTTPAPTTTSTTTPTTTTPTTAPADSTAGAATSSTLASTTPSSTSTPATTPPVSASPTTTPVKPKPAPTITPIESAEPAWYENTMVLAGAGGALLLVGLLALMRFMRKPKPVMQISDGTTAEDFGAALVGEDEHQLLDQIAQNPSDPDLSLRLLSMYYAQREGSKFEAAAEAMYAHVADPTQPEWQQVKAMGEELCPHNPLFGGHEDIATTAYGHDGHHSMDGFDGGHQGADDAFDLGGFSDEAKPAADEHFDFDLADHSAAAASAAPAAEPEHQAPATVVRATPLPAAAPAAAPAKAPDDFFAGEDAIGTKLDLARAYLDMGDPEGARSMLDEVMSEGNEAQKGEARKLLAEIK